MWEKSVIPKCGVNLLAQWAAGGKLTISSVKGGTGKDTDLSAITRLHDEKQTLEIRTYSQIDSGVRYEIIMTAPEHSYVCHQIGVFAKLNDGAETLVAVYQDENGIDIPAKTDMPEFQYKLYAAMAMDTSGDLDVNVNSALWATMEEVEERLNGIEETLMAKAETKLSEVDTKISAAETKFNEAKRVADEAKNSVETLQSTVSSNKSELEGKITAAEATANAAKTKAEELAKKVNELGTKVGDAESFTGQIQDKVSEALAGKYSYYAGQNITHTIGEEDGTVTVTSTGSEIKDAKVGDLYLNTANNDFYKCTTAGDAQAAHWEWIGKPIKCILTSDGSKYEEGGSLPDGTFVFVYGEESGVPGAGGVPGAAPPEIQPSDIDAMFEKG